MLSLIALPVLIVLKELPKKNKEVETKALKRHDSKLKISDLMSFVDNDSKSG